MVHVTLNITNQDVVEALYTYSRRTRHALYIISATGYISEAVLYPPDSQEEEFIYQGYRRIESLIGHFEPYDENAFIRIKLASVDRRVRIATPSWLLAGNTIVVEMNAFMRPPPQPPVVIGRKRIYAYRP